MLPHTLYDGSDGLRGDPFPLTAPAVARGGDGRLWFLTSDGVAVVSPERHEKDRIAPPVVIEAIAADQRPIGPRVTPPAAANRQPPHRLCGPELRCSRKGRFRYLMEGFDTDWVDAGTRRQAFYTNLPPGDYRFRVRASNDGVVSEREAVWAFALAPAFYQTDGLPLRWSCSRCPARGSRGKPVCTRYAGTVLGDPDRADTRGARSARHPAPESARRPVPVGRSRRRHRRLERVCQSAAGSPAAPGGVLRAGGALFDQGLAFTDSAIQGSRDCD